MSLIITVHTNEGIVMASDSRTTHSAHYEAPSPDGKAMVITNNQGVHYSDTTDKTFLAPNSVGISTCGDADIGGKPLSVYIEDFLQTRIYTNTTVTDTAKQILEYFRSFKPAVLSLFLISFFI